MITLTKLRKCVVKIKTDEVLVRSKSLKYWKIAMQKPKSQVLNQSFYQIDDIVLGGH